MELKKREQENQITIWIVTSILLHLLMVLVAFFWYLELSMQRHLLHKTQPLLPKSKQQDALQLKPLPPKEQAPVYTLIPGRKAVTESTKPKVESQKNIPEQTKEHKEPEEQLQKAVEQLPQSQHKTATPIKKPPTHRHETIKQQLLQPTQELKPNLEHDKKDHFIEEQTEIKKEQETKDPTISKKKVSLQDLKLGFAKFMQEGNNDILLQHGNTNQPPDAQSLRLITYNQQVARAMRDEILTHSQYDQLSNIRGKKVLLTITLERNGKLTDMRIVQGSDNELLNKVILESIKSINLYPPVPKHISNIPHHMTWNLLF